MIKEALEYITGLQTPTLFDPEFLKADSLTDRPLHYLPSPPMPKPLVVNTLTGLVDYCRKHEMPPVGLMHVVDPSTVRLLSPLVGRHNEQRIVWVEATTASTVSQGFQFERFMTIPQFIIGLQAHFSHTTDRDVILKLVSNIKAEQSQAYLDTGYTQEVTAKRSTKSSMVESVAVPNPVTLKPYRTFLEIDQPESSFIFRLKSADGQPPECGLFEASGGAWKLDAILRIKEWLKEQAIMPMIIA